MAKKKIRFTGDVNYKGWNDYGYRWKLGDEHAIDEAIADYAVKTFPSLFVLIGGKIEEKIEIEVEEKQITDLSNKKLSGKGSK